MIPRWIIFGIVFGIATVMVFGWQPLRVETVQPLRTVRSGDSLINVQDYQIPNLIQTRLALDQTRQRIVSHETVLDSLGQGIATHQLQADSFFIQFGRDVCSFGDDTVYLPIKYTDTLFCVSVTSLSRDSLAANVLVGAWPMSDSSFAVRFYSTWANPYQWHTIGLKAE